jgi:ribonucleotide reductase class II
MEFKSPTGSPTFFRTYSRRTANGRESYAEVCDRTTNGLAELGQFTEEQKTIVHSMMKEIKVLPSGRWMWVGGTDWIKKPENYYSAYNCNSTNINDIESFGLMMALGMMGCGTGGVLESRHISKLPPVRNSLQVRVVGTPGKHLVRLEETTVEVYEDLHDYVEVDIVVGDSRQGWVNSMTTILQLAFEPLKASKININVDISSVRPDGTPIKGFGGVANPIQLSRMYERVVAVLNRYVGRQLDAEGVCLLLDEVALTIVAGNVRRYAGMRQFDSTARLLKENLWIQDSDGNWKIDPERDALRMSNHTRVYHYKPSLQECVDAVRSQYYSGEGAIQWAGEAVARANADLLATEMDKKKFLYLYPNDRDLAEGFLISRTSNLSMRSDELEHRMQRYGLNPCLAAGTMVLTKDNPFAYVEDLVGKTVEVWDGLNWRTVDNFRVTGENQPVYNLQLNVLMTNVDLDCCDVVTATAYHTFILENGERKQLKDLNVGDKLQIHDQGLFGDAIKSATVHSIEYSHIADKVYCCTVEGTNAFALSSGLLIGNCGEIVFSDGLCNLSEIHLNQFDPLNIEEQKLAFATGGLSVGALLHHEFIDERYRKSRELDPIVGVSFTGLFDFFVKAFGSGWLRWWKTGRSRNWEGLSVEEADNLDLVATKLGLGDNDSVWLEADAALFIELEKRYLNLWKEAARDSVWSYCDEHGLKRPNRYTTTQPSGTKSLLTGASPGWHPPKAQRYIRRITFTAHDPVALTCMDYGYSVVPSQSCKDNEGKLLDDPFDPRVQEWLVEIPVEVSWANLPGADKIDISRFSAAAQFDFYMQVQKHYVTHNTSGTIELRENEIEELGTLIHDAIRDDEGYISCALLARFDDKQTYPRLPFEPISKETYDALQQQVLDRRKSEDFQSLLERYDSGWNKDQGVTGCDSDKCLIGGK